MRQSPDVLLIISDDHRWCDSGCYGSADAQTPNIDRIAREGMRLDRYYTVAPMCAPARMSLYSGVYPVRNGGYPNHSRAYPETRSIAHHLRSMGYRVGLHGKKHFGPDEVFPFDAVDDIAAFINADAGQRYCLVVGTHEPGKPVPRFLRQSAEPTVETVG